MKNGAKKPIYNYDFLDIVTIKNTNIFWKIIDNLSFKLVKLGKFYDKSISNNYIRETKIFDLSKSKNILHIGCGAYPISTIVLSNFTKANIVGIDINPKSVEKATEIIKEKGLGKKIQIKQGDGTSFPIESFDTIIVSSCSVPKSKILEHLFKSSKTNCKIILRERYGPSRLISSYIENYKDFVTIVDKIHNYAFPTLRWDSFYLVKK